jgi:SAM-dependent methyltransferase
MADLVKPPKPPAEVRTEDWDVMWQKNFTPWDRFEPNPALVDTLNEKSDIIDPNPQGSDATRRKRALIPGCGRGYDVLLFASYGYDAYGLDVSQTAVDACRELDKEQGEDAVRYPVRDTKLGRGSRHFLAADFFKDDLTSHTNGGSFDIIYDYTFLCALLPELRPQWYVNEGYNPISRSRSRLSIGVSAAGRLIRTLKLDRELLSMSEKLC